MKIYIKFLPLIMRLNPDQKSLPNYSNFCQAQVGLVDIFS